MYKYFAFSIFYVCASCNAAAGEWDPTRPSNFQITSERQVKTKQALKLESTLMGAHRNLAVISGKFYGLGDRTPLGRVTAIKPGAVIIQGDKRHVLRLPSREVRQKNGGKK